MPAEIIKLANVQLPAKSAAVLPAGWRRPLDGPVNEQGYRRRAVYVGVRSNIDAAYAAVKTALGDDVLSLSVQEDARSGVATISAEYSSHVGQAGPGGEHPDDNAPVSPDTYQLQSVAVPTALAAHPAFVGIEGAVIAIDYALAHCDDDGLIAAAATSAAAAKYAALRRAGVTQWEGTGFSWRVTRHYSTLADPSAIAAAAAAAISVGRVYAWAAVEGHGEIDEPKYVVTDAAGQAAPAASYEWRLAGVSVSRTETNLDLTWEYQGAWKWASALYPGGTWAPPLPA